MQAGTEEITYSNVILSMDTGQVKCPGEGGQLASGRAGPLGFLKLTRNHNCV